MNMVIIFRARDTVLDICSVLAFQVYGVYLYLETVKKCTLVTFRNIVTDGLSGMLIKKQKNTLRACMTNGIT